MFANTKARLKISRLSTRRYPLLVSWVADSAIYYHVAYDVTPPSSSELRRSRAEYSLSVVDGRTLGRCMVCEKTAKMIQLRNGSALVSFRIEWAEGPQVKTCFDVCRQRRQLFKGKSEISDISAKVVLEATRRRLPEATKAWRARWYESLLEKPRPWTRCP